MRIGDSFTTFWDHSTPQGNFYIFCTRIYKPWILFVLLGIGCLLIIYDHSNNNGGNSSRLSLGVTHPEYVIDFTSGKLRITGQGDLGGAGIEAELLSIPSTIDPPTLTALELKNVLIHAPHFSTSLRSHTNLQSIRMDQVWILGEFGSVFLPNLSEFRLNQFRNERTDSYKRMPRLKSLLFFELDEGAPWEMPKDLLTLGVAVQVSVGGTRILDIDRDVGRIHLNVHNCQEVLSGLEPDAFPAITHLTLSWCSIGPSDVPSSLKYLNLNNAVPPTPAINSILKSLPSLEEFHGFLPLSQGGTLWNNNSDSTYIQFTSLPPSLTTLSLSNINLVLGTNLRPLNYLREVSFENSLGSSRLIESFDLVFANVTKIAIFNTNSIEDPYKLIIKILAIRPKWILIENFNQSFLTHQHSTDEIRRKWNSYGILPGTKDFTLELSPRTGDYVMSPLTLYQTNFYRFSLLGFNRVDTYEDYVIWDRNF